MIGEIGGATEEDAAQFLIDEVKRGRKKRMVGFIAGVRCRWASRMKHVGVIISGRKERGGVEDRRMEAAGHSRRRRHPPARQDLGSRYSATEDR